MQMAGRLNEQQQMCFVKSSGTQQAANAIILGLAFSFLTFFICVLY